MDYSEQRNSGKKNKVQCSILFYEVTELESQKEHVNEGSAWYPGCFIGKKYKPSSSWLHYWKVISKIYFIKCTELGKWVKVTLYEENVNYFVCLISTLCDFKCNRAFWNHIDKALSKIHKGAFVYIIMITIMVLHWEKKFCGGKRYFLLGVKLYRMDSTFIQAGPCRYSGPKIKVEKRRTDL